MNRKKDMYINYERSSRKRRNKKANWFLITLAVVLAIGLAGITFYIFKDYLFSKQQVTFAEQKKDTDADPGSMPSMEPTAAPTATPTPTTTPTPTPTPTPIPSPIPTEAPETAELSAVKIKGIYVTASTAGSKKMDSLKEMTAATEINAMVIDVKDDSGRITYAMESPIAQEINAVTNTVRDMDELISSLKEDKVYTIARIVAFKDPYLAKMKPELAIRNQDGTVYKDNNGDSWVNPYNEKVWEYLVEVAAMAAETGFDEIQFDYIRFSTGTGIEQADFGEAAKAKTKEDIITEFTQYAYEHLKPLGVFVSADVYGTIINSKIDAARVGQNYVEMAKHLDYICPMIYPSHFGEGNYGVKYPDLEPQEIIRKSLNASKEKLSVIPEGDHKAIVRPWLQDFTASWIKHYQKYGKKQLREQINGVYDAGYEEWILWNAGNNYTEEGLLAEQ
jgi:hypothetical protein